MDAFNCRCLYRGIHATQPLSFSVTPGTATATDSTDPHTGTARYRCWDGTYTKQSGVCGTKCAAQTATWTKGSNSCSGSLAVGYPGQVKTATDSTNPTTGSARYACLVSNSTWLLWGTPTCTLAQCPADTTDISWVAGNNTCYGRQTATNAGSSVTVTDSTGSPVGSITYACNSDGTWGAHSAITCGSSCTYRAARWNNAPSCPSASTVACGTTIPNQTASCNTGQNTNCSTIQCTGTGSCQSCTWGNWSCHSTLNKPYRACSASGVAERYETKDCPPGPCVNGTCSCTRHSDCGSAEYCDACTSYQNSTCTGTGLCQSCTLGSNWCKNPDDGKVRQSCKVSNTTRRIILVQTCSSGQICSGGQCVSN